MKTIIRSVNKFAVLGFAVILSHCAPEKKPAPTPTPTGSAEAAVQQAPVVGQAGINYPDL